MVRGVYALLFAALLLGVSSMSAADKEAKTLWVYLGTYTGKDSKGIYKALFDPATGKLSDAELVAETESPSFLAISPDRKYLYAVNEVGNYGGSKNAGSVTAFAIEPKTGKLKQLNVQSSGGAHPCHVSMDRTGKVVLVANYSGGNCASYPVLADGKLGDMATLMQHKAVEKGRTHAHSINIDPSNKFAVCADLGLDQLLVYKVDLATGKMTAHEPPFGAVAPGAGPRHFAFHPTKPLAFVINETKCTLNSLKWDAAKGTFTVLDTANTLPRDVGKGDSTAEVVIHPNGKWIYGSNRGHDSIVAFESNDEGKLKLIGHQGAGIKTPRNFCIDPTGQWLLVGNQSGGNVSVFKIDATTGALTATTNGTKLASPVCIRFIAPVE